MLVHWARLVKSDAEIECLRRAARLADVAMAAAVEALRPGARQCEVLAAAMHASVAAGSDPSPALPPILATGKQTACAHPAATDTVIQEDQVSFLELSGTYRKYCCPIARTVYTGAVLPAALAPTFAAARDALDAALAAAVPGSTAEKVKAEFDRVLAQHGKRKASRLGYSIGVGFSPDWGEKTVSFREGDTTVLAKNMVFHLIAGIWSDEGGMELSEAIVITDQQPEKLCQTPRKVFFC